MAETTRWFEDFTVGETIPLGSREMTRTAILDFARKYDPQPMHLDEAAGRASLLGDLAASGWHTACTLMRLFVDGLLAHTASLGSPGIRTLKWRKPVKVGDRLTASVTILEARASESRPRLGFLEGRFHVVDQTGAEVLMMEATLMIERRAAA